MIEPCFCHNHTNCKFLSFYFSKQQGSIFIDSEFDAYFDVSDIFLMMKLSLDAIIYVGRYLNQVSLSACSLFYMNLEEESKLIKPTYVQLKNEEPIAR